MPSVNSRAKFLAMLNLQEYVIQLMHVTYKDLVRIANEPSCWNTKPSYSIKEPWQGSNMQSIFTSIYDIPIERDPYNVAAFKSLITAYKIEIDWAIVFKRYDKAYRSALDEVNGYRRSLNLPLYPSVEDARNLPVK